MSTPTRRIMLALTALTVVMLSALSIVSPANADTPSPAVAAPFLAKECPGTTGFDPTQGEGGVDNLLSVFGGRLAAYNAGGVVPLYSATGYNLDAYPPLCGVRYVASAGGPVSEWMFCTDLHANTCGDTDSSGNLIEGSSPVDPLERLSGNPRLSGDQEKIIAYLIQHGHSYEGVGSQSFGGVTTASANVNSPQRMALQTLIWCVSDTTTNADLLATCANSMNSAEQARILALVPSIPTITLDFDSSGAALAVGGTARFDLLTNLFDQPIAITSTGSTGATLTVCDGEATLTAGNLTVAGNASPAARTVTLCATASSAGTLDVAASASPASTSHIGWNQSPTVIAGKGCQVFAAFYTDKQAAVSDTATTSFAATVTPTTPTPTPTTTAPTPQETEPTISPTDDTEDAESAVDSADVGSDDADDANGTLPDTGGTASPLLLGAAGSLLLAGIAMTFMSRRKRSTN